MGYRWQIRFSRVTPARIKLSPPGTQMPNWLDNYSTSGYAKWPDHYDQWLDMYVQGCTSQVAQSTKCNDTFADSVLRSTNCLHKLGMQAGADRPMTAIGCRAKHCATSGPTATFTWTHRHSAYLHSDIGIDLT